MSDPRRRRPPGTPPTLSRAPQSSPRGVGLTLVLAGALLAMAAMAWFGPVPTFRYRATIGFEPSAAATNALRRLAGEDLLAAAANRLGDEMPSIAPGAALLSDLLNSEASRLDLPELPPPLAVTLDPEAQRVQAVAPEPQGAARLAEAGSEHLIAIEATTRLAALRQATTEAAAAVTAYSAELGALRKELAAWPTETAILDDAALAELEVDVANATRRLERAVVRLAQLDQAAVATDRLDRMVDLAPGSDLPWLRAELRQARERQARVAATYPPNHPLRLAAAGEVDELTAAVEATIDGVLRGARTEREAAETRVSALTDQRDQAITARLEAAAKADVKRAREERAGELRNTLTTARLALQAAQRSETDTASPLVLAGTVKVRRFAEPLEPAIAFGGAGLAGAGLGLMVSGLLARQSARRAPTLAEMEVRAGAPLLADLSGAKPHHGAGRSRTAETDLRLQRALLRLDSLEPPPGTIALIPVAGARGTADLAQKLARCAAAEGRKALLVDGDLTGRELSRLLRLDQAAGLAEAVNGTADWRDTVRSEGESGPAMLAAGRDTALRQAARLQGSLAELAERFEISVIAAPAAAETDALRLARAADAVVILVNPGRVDRKQFIADLDELAAVSVKPVGLITVGAHARA